MWALCLRSNVGMKARSRVVLTSCFRSLASSRMSLRDAILASCQEVNDSASALRALAAEPPLLLLDEPFGALDPLTRASLQRQFIEISKRLKKTAVFVTHDVREALLLGSRIGLMHKGQLLLLETPENFLKSKNKQALAYLETLSLAPSSSHPAEGSG